jgi:NAD(P)-dependent dehydrogenase (short-subunit alcohol dehydrogenase family)
MDHHLANRTILLTGASRGLGEAIARQLAAAGARLALLARDPHALDNLANSLRAAVGPTHAIAAYPCDLADLSSIHAVYARIVRELGNVDVLVNNAAIQGPLGPLESLNFEQWRKVFDVDLFAAVRLSQLVIPGMRRKNGGKIINISGGGATGPRPDVSAYACAKTALVRLTETLAEELKDARIDVNAVSPGAMNTRMLEETLAAGPTGIRREYAAAMKRKHESSGVPPEQAAELVVFLASPESDGITGRLIAAMWDDWKNLPARRGDLANTDIYTLRRIVPKDRGFNW